MELAELAVFVRAPVVGLVKTRLHSALGVEGATELYRAFVEDTLALCIRVRESGRVGLSIWADDVDHPDVARWADSLDTTPKQQPDGDLGRRLSMAFDRGFSNAERVVVIGSDAPTLPMSLLVSAFNRLADAPWVLAPSNDGGYCLVGAAGTSPSFDSVRWSTELTYRDTRAANPSLELAVLPPWYDVDDEADLETLRAHLSSSPSVAPASAAMLSRLRPAQR